MRLCSIGECNKKYYSRDLCKIHYERYMRINNINGYKNRKINIARKWKQNNKEKIKEYNDKTKFIVKRRYSGSKSQARRRKKDWNINFEDYSKLISKNCIYCKKSIKNKTGVGLDRLDNSKGYVLSNVVTCCGDCNSIRGDKLTHEETIVVIEAVLKHRKLQNQEQIINDV